MPHLLNTDILVRSNLVWLVFFALAEWLFLRLKSNKWRSHQKESIFFPQAQGLGSRAACWKMPFPRAARQDQLHSVSPPFKLHCRYGLGVTHLLFGFSAEATGPHRNPDPLGESQGLLLRWYLGKCPPLISHVPPFWLKSSVQWTHRNRLESQRHALLMGFLWFQANYSNALRRPFTKKSF